MHWWQRLDALQGQYGQQGGVPDTRYGLTLDQATAPWQNADPKVQQYLADTAKSQEEGGVFGNFMGAVGEVLDFGDPLFKALMYPYKQLSTKVLSPATHIIPVIFNEDWQNQINKDSAWDAVFDGRSWHQIMMAGEKDSFGRGIIKSNLTLATALDPDDPGYVGINDKMLKDYEDDWQMNALSGPIDFVGVMFLDPLYVVGKAAMGARALSTVTKLDKAALNTPEAWDAHMASEPVARWLNWTEGKTPQEIARHRVLKRNQQRGQIGDLLAHATMKDKDLIYRIVNGQQEALTELQRTSPAIAAEFNRMRGQVEFYQLKTLPSLTSTVSSSNKAKPLGSRQKAKLLAAKTGEVEKYARENRTMLKLNDTEFNPLATAGPFASRTEAQQHVYNTFATVYKPLGDADQTTLLFNRSGEIERTPDDLENALTQYREFVDDARTSQRHLRASEQATPPKGRKRTGRQRLGDDLAADEGIPSRFVSPWSETRLTGQRPARLTRVDEDGLTVKASKRDMRGMAQARPVEPPFIGPVPQRYALWDYDAAGVTAYGDKMKGQLDLFDDFLTPEIRQLDSEVGFYQRIMDDATEVSQNGIRPGIFASGDVLPKAGIYGKYAEGAVKVGTAIDKAYQRRYDGELKQYGFMSRPVYYALRMGDGLSRGSIPTSFKPSNPEAWRDVDTWLKRVPDLSSTARGAWVRQLMGATEDAEKLRIVEQMEATVIRHMLHVHGVHNYETVKSIVEVTLGSRKAYIGRMADDALKRADAPAPRGSANGAYSAVENTKGLAPFGLTPDGTALVPGPLLAKQLLNEHPLLPLDELNRAFKRDGKWLYGATAGPIRDNVVSFGQTFNRVWKTSVLLRAGYVVRTVSDEVLLAGATLGSLIYYAGAVPGAARTVRNVPTRAGNLRTRAANRKAQYKRQLPEGELVRPPHERGRGGVEVGDARVTAQGLFDGPTGDLYKGLVGSDQRDLFSIYDNMLIGLRKGNNWGVLRPKEEEVSHLAAWTHALNFQLGQDKLGKIFLQGGSYDDAIKWLATHEGQAYAKKMPHMARQQDDWIKSVAFMVDHYTGGDSALARAASEGKVTPAMLRKVPIESRPPVHGGQIDYARGEGTLNEFFNNLSNGFYGIASRMPTDKLVRHPVADMMYQRRLRELVAGAEAQGVNIAMHPEKLYHFEEVARQFTAKEMSRVFKDHLFNSPQTALRFAMPFFGAWRASIARWATAVAEDPSIVARGAQGWQGLHKPFDVVDEDGNLLENQDSQTYGMNTRNAVVMRMPEKYAKMLGAIPLLPGSESYEDAPGRVIPLRSFNTVLQGDPWYNAGFGPFVTVPIANLVREQPYLSKAAKETGVLPFGARADWTQQLLPTAGQRAIAGEEGFDNRQYTQTFFNILRVEVTKESLGQRGPITDMKEIRDKTDDLMKLRLLESFMLPFSARPQYYAKEWEGKLPKEWQFLASKFRQYREAAETPEQGEEMFLKHFPEAWLYMRSTSENKSGIPANFESWGKSKKVAYLAAKTPDIFASAAGVQDREYKKFDATVYDAQMAAEWNPATGDKYRDVRDPATFLTEARSREGWSKYAKMMDYLRGQLAQRKLQTVDDPGAQDLKDLKSRYIDYISDINPDWAAAYGSPDIARRRRILEQARIVAADKNLPTDPHRTLELQSLGYYLGGRDYFAAQLKARGAVESGSYDINARSNEDLLYKWNRYREYLAQKDTRFSEIWLDRHFGNDYFQELK